MTQAATAADVARWRGREAARDLLANADTRPGTGDNSTVSPEALTTTARSLQTAASRGSAGSPPQPEATADTHFRAGLNPSGPTRPVDNTGARPDASTTHPSRDRGAARDGR